jgi:hypothetical protein
MDFTLSEEQDELAGLTRKILAQRGVAGHGVRGYPRGSRVSPRASRVGHAGAPVG